MKTRLIGFMVVLASFTFGWFWISYQTLIESPLSSSLKEPVLFEISAGQSFNSVVSSLEERDLLDHPGWFKLLARQEQAAGKIKAGEYQISPELTPKSLLALFVSGKSYQHAFTIVEGWNLKQFLQAIRESELFATSKDAQTDEQLLEKLGLTAAEAEGRFLADTYLFPKGTSVINFLNRAREELKKELQSEWEKRAEGLPLKTPEEALILASIIEKETALADERPEIAGVFVRRLHKGMKLQTDPTVIYGMGDRYDGNIRKKDLLKDTPYNTYTRYGLPPTPIAMSGRDAIRAALHPSEGKSLYFVAKSDGSGAHVFSSTLKEHNRAVDYYQRKIRPK